MRSVFYQHQQTENRPRLDQLRFPEQHALELLKIAAHLLIIPIPLLSLFFFLNDPPPPEIYPLPPPDSLPISPPVGNGMSTRVSRITDAPTVERKQSLQLYRAARGALELEPVKVWTSRPSRARVRALPWRSEEHTSELQSQSNLVCRLLLEKKK